MTKKQLIQLNDIIYNLTLAIDYINRKDIEICTTIMLNSQSYFNKEGKGLQPQTKFRGSDLHYLLNANEKLQTFIEHNTKGN